MSTITFRRRRWGTTMAALAAMASFALFGSTPAQAEPTAPAAEYTVTGTVYAETNAGTVPLAGANVWLMDSNGEGTDPDGSSQLTDAAGRYTIADVAVTAGTYQVVVGTSDEMAGASDLVATARVSVTVVAGTAVTEAPDLTLVRAGAVSGTLTMATPPTTFSMTDVNVFLSNGNPEQGLATSPDANGNFRFEQVTPGTYTMSFDTWSSEMQIQYYHYAEWEQGTPIVVTAGETTTGIDQTLMTTDSVITPGTATVAGAAVVGSTLTADPGTWSPLDDSELEYQWIRAGYFLIEGATHPTYTVTADDINSTLSVRVTGYRSGFMSSEQVFSAETAPVPVVAVPSGVTAPVLEPISSPEAGQIAVEGSHFDGNTYVNVYLHSTPMFLGSLPVDPATGLVTGTVYLPAGVTGSHHLELIGGTNGYSASTPQFTLDAAGVVGISDPEEEAVAPQGDFTEEPSGTQLANTGAATSPILAVGAMALLLGVFAMGAVRRRTRVVKTSAR